MNNLFYLLIVSERVLPFQHWRRKHHQQQNRNQEQQQRRGQMFPFQIFSAAAAETKNQMIILILVKKHKKTSAVFDHNKNSGEEIRIFSAACFETRPRFSDLPLKSQICSCLNWRDWPKHFKQVFFLLEFSQLATAKRFFVSKLQKVDSFCRYSSNTRLVPTQFVLK